MRVWFQGVGGMRFVGRFLMMVRQRIDRSRSEPGDEVLARRDAGRHGIRGASGGGRRRVERMRRRAGHGDADGRRRRLAN
ncbi:hypothetical protein DIE19_23105 [Burkholderia sp. Bp9126]|nr:hypothetical protein DIE19_23105 [Burkholderia sp. Bp9126]